MQRVLSTVARLAVCVVAACLLSACSSPSMRHHMVYALPPTGELLFLPER